MNRLLYLVRFNLYAALGKTNNKLAIRVNYLRDNGAKVGENSRIFSDIGGSEPYLIEIENDVVISTGVSLITHDNAIGMHLGDKATDIFGKIHIGYNSFIGANSTILPGVNLGPNTIVGAGSVVTKSFPEGHVVLGGNPAKIITNTENYVEKNKGNALDVSGLTFLEKKNKVLEYNSEKLINK